MGSIKTSTVRSVMPKAIRAEFGDALGNEICRVMQVIDRRDGAFNMLLDAMREAKNDSQREKIIDAVWSRYYQKIAASVITIE